MSVHPYHRGVISEEYAICSNCKHWITPELSEPSIWKKIGKGLGIYKGPMSNVELFKRGKCEIREWLNSENSPIIPPDNKSCDRIDPIYYVASKSEVHKMLNNPSYEPVCVPKEQVSIKYFNIPITKTP